MDAKKEMKKSDKLRLDLISTIIVTLIALAVTVAAVISMAWFASNKETTGEGMGVSVAGERYYISFLSSVDSKYEAERLKISGGYNEKAITWKMTKSENLYNYSENGDQSNVDGGIFPGAEGVISFIVNRNVDEPIELELLFKVKPFAYGKKTVKNDKNEDILVTDYNTVTEVSEENIANLLLGHIMLFGSREGQNGNYIYSDPILPDENGNRTILKRFDTASEQYGLKQTKVDIYWVWPYTLSTILDVRSNNSIKTVPFMNTEEADYGRVKENVCNHPNYYLKGVPFFDPPKTSDQIVEEIAEDYIIYGDYYDRADNDIGYLINFMLLSMEIEEKTSQQGGGE